MEVAFPKHENQRQVLRASRASTHKASGKHEWGWPVPCCLLSHAPHPWDVGQAPRAHSSQTIGTARIFPCALVLWLTSLLRQALHHPQKHVHCFQSRGIFCRSSGHKAQKLTDHKRTSMFHLKLP
eukprot:1157566-Pelagomonas_calceolata.AAC.10